MPWQQFLEQDYDLNADIIKRFQIKNTGYLILRQMFMCFGCRSGDLI